MRDYIRLNQVPSQVPGRPTISTIFRWMQRGVRGVRLRGTLIGGRRYVKRDDLDAFLAALNSPMGTVLPTSAAAERARRELEALGA